jgi:hypothetical protein
MFPSGKNPSLLCGGRKKWGWAESAGEVRWHILPWTCGVDEMLAKASRWRKRVGAFFALF